MEGPSVCWSSTPSTNRRSLMFALLRRRPTSPSLTSNGRYICCSPATLLPSTRWASTCSASRWAPGSPRRGLSRSGLGSPTSSPRTTLPTSSPRFPSMRPPPPLPPPPLPHSPSPNLPSCNKSLALHLDLLPPPHLLLPPKLVLFQNQDLHLVPLRDLIQTPNLTQVQVLLLLLLLLIRNKFQTRIIFFKK